MRFHTARHKAAEVQRSELHMAVSGVSFLRYDDNVLQTCHQDVPRQWFSLYIVVWAINLTSTRCTSGTPTASMATLATLGDIWDIRPRAQTPSRT
eukprot:4514944-Amphidinium_carterae.1